MRRYQILLVDDDTDFCNTAVGVLADEGHNVQIAHDENRALELISQEEFDFAIIDVRLHGDDTNDESGLHFAASVSIIQPNTCLLIITGGPVRSKHVVRAVKLYGAVSFLEKGPNIGQELVDHIKDVKRRPPSLTNTRLSISLVAGQPIELRSTGDYVRSARTQSSLQLDVEHYARKVENVRKADAKELRFHAKDIGMSLWQETFGKHELAREMLLATKEASHFSPLLLQGPLEYLRLPFEFLHPGTDTDTAEYVILQRPVARFIHHVATRRRAISPAWLAGSRKLRVLLIASNTPDPSIPGSIPGTDREVSELHRYLLKQTNMPVSVTAIPTEYATYQRIQDELASTSFDVVHYAGHGTFVSASPEDSYLSFWERENRQGTVQEMTAREIKYLLQQSKVRLMYLSNCYGTATSAVSKGQDNDFLGIADAIVQSGIPSVVGFRWPVSDSGAPKLARSFYKSLLDQGSPEAALWHARRELYTKMPSDSAWLSPILIHQE